MTETTHSHWLAKLAAWTHDPAEKALVLMRDPAGHEGGTVRALHKTIFPDGFPKELAEHVQRADHWASAADRPQFPRDEKDGRYAAWTQVRFDQQPVLIHPLSGTALNLAERGALDIDPAHIRAMSTDHFGTLIVRKPDGTIDTKRTALNFWRFGPELDGDDLKLLWQLLPADTRIPDHTIWTHLDLTAAFASAFTSDANANPALLSVSFGPVQSFIEQARTTSDLWAGSHLLSRMAWEGLKVVCDRLGPDAVVFPHLRGVPQVDLWLRDDIGLAKDSFAECEWAKERTDANPLFAAALPNKFVALVPADQARELAEAVTTAVRRYVHETAAGMLAEVLDAAGIPDAPDLACHAQLSAQLEGFPEVHWAVVPFSPLIKAKGSDIPDVTELMSAGEPFFGEHGSEFLGSQAWERLSKPLDLEGTKFYRPNAGVLYPAIYELLDRVAASAKALRAAPQRPNGGEQGYRCDLSGDAEWLTHDPQHLTRPKGSRPPDTLWNRAARNRPGISRKGEHLSALAMVKRMWPRWFIKTELQKVDVQTQRFVVSTHTLAISTSLDRWLDQGAPLRNADPILLEDARKPGTERAALPRRLMKKLYGKNDLNEEQRALVRSLPALMERDASDDPEARNETAIRVGRLLDSKPEAYYALILLDGDRMGAWLSGSDPKLQVSRLDTFHPQIRERMKSHFTRPEHSAYLATARSVSPGRHMAISSALNGFSLYLAQDIVENRCKGKLIYAGGDDVMAMVAVDDLLACLTLLRAAYAGLEIPSELATALQLDMTGLRIRYGHAMLEKRLIRVMGEKATASAGAVIAHHTAPLGAVLRALRASEKRAKNRGGRDAFDVTLLKRSGGATELTLPWRNRGSNTLDDSPAQLLADLVATFACDTSRKAAYLTQGWLPHLPVQMPAGDLTALLSSSLAYQLERQSGGDRWAASRAPVLARKLAELATSLQTQETSAADIVRDVLAVAEFLAREGRSKKDH